MREVGLLCFGVVVAGSLVFACVGDAPATAALGRLDGPCLTDGSCNPGLTCATISGGSRCVAATDAAVEDSSTTVDSAVDSGPRACSFAPTPFPCTGQSAGPACYGQAQSCTLSGCGGSTDVRWECFSPNQCGSTPCCIASTSAALTPTTNCSQGGLKVLAVDGGGGVPGSVCGSGLACAAGEIQLCQFNTQCPKGEVCSPVKVSGSGGSASNLVLGACMPE